MIIVREVFFAKPGQASKLAKLFREVMSVAYPDGSVTVMTDLISEFNKVVLETRLPDLTAFEARMKEYQTNTSDEMKEKMKNYTEMYAEGRREIYQIVE